ncbi:dihydroorotase [Iodidimonas sp. SYSU 1G8]|uniref:dihydroorotase n=1 Tax=Iodidimonas sp. SYSU 1G8 TaxID=3133967 RepID=UPI0031FF20A6
MGTSFDLLIRNATCVSHRGIGPADVGIRDGKTAAIGDLSQASAHQVIDATGLHLLPGVIDSQVHFREPGLEYKEDLESGSRGAVLGGVTAVFEMPNTKPSTTTAEALQYKLDRAAETMWCDHAFYVGAAAENIDLLPELEKLPGCCGVKLFMGASTGDLLVHEDEVILRVLRSGSRRVSIHSEDEYRMRERKGLAEEGNVLTHPVVRDDQSAIIATQRLLALARQAGRRIHVLHITTADEIELLSRHKDIATVEVTPQHLTLAAPECYEQLGTRAQMNPPIRTAAHRDGLWRGIADGIVDVLGSDHAPHTLEEKAKAYPNSPSGMTGVQTLVPLMLDHINAGRLNLQQFVDLTSAGPARIWGLAGKGRLAVGWDADYTLVDMKASRTIEDSWIASKSGWTPFHGRTVTGWPVGTIIRGQKVMWEGQLASAPAGAPVRFNDTLRAHG